MAYSEAKKAEVLAAFESNPELTTGELSRRFGVPKTTVGNWLRLAKTEEDAAGGMPATAAPSAHLLPSALEERDVVSDLLSKAGWLLKGIPQLDATKERLEQASAIDKLLSKYLAMLGRAEDGKEESGDEAKALALLASFGLEPSSPTASAGLEQSGS